MPVSKQNKIGKRPEKEEVTLSDTLHDTWKVMKPFVRFSVKSMTVIAHSLIYIVKHIPKPEEHGQAAKKNKIIKIS